ncbi:MAG TPA: class I tRNA ligase family protein, partial [Actinomycetota bacterium]
DLRVARQNGVPVVNPVDPEGRFDQRTGPYAGMYIRDADQHIIEDLGREGLLVWAGTHRHSYPFCWRCDTPLFYYARPAWYIRTTAYKQLLLEANETVNWFPEHIKHGRYGDWLENNVDWALSRERYWGTPLPIWICPDGHETAIGSLAELSERSGMDLTGMDLHKPGIDEVAITCPACGKQARRVSYLIDVWFDAGAMPYAQWGYRGPGSEGEALFTKRFPADFIAEAIDQTRGWFYTLMAEAVQLFGENSYRNVLVLGHLVDATGRKMSKRLGNVIDPWEVIDRFGADALRWFLVAGGSPWAQRRVYMEAFEDIVRRFLLTVWNTYSFFVTYANIDAPDLARAPLPRERPVLDRWVLSQLHATILVAGDAMEGYDVTAAARRIEQFVDDLSNWYVRRARRRFWKSSRSGDGGAEGGNRSAHGSHADKLSAYATLHECLTGLVGVMAPITPFVSEAIYQNLSAERAPGMPESLHLTDFPKADRSLIDQALDEAMSVARDVVSLGRQVRTDAKVRVRQPLARAVVSVPGDHGPLLPLLPLIADELNVKEVVFTESAEELSGWRAKPDFRRLGPRLGSEVKEVAAALARDDGSLAAALAGGEPVSLRVPSGMITLSPADVELSQQTLPGWGLASDGAVTVALDLELTEELKAEGAVREIIRAVQDLRKSAGLDVADRIVLAVQAPPDLERAVATHVRTLTAEVLAVALGDAPLDQPDGQTDASVDGRVVRLWLRRA